MLAIKNGNISVKTADGCILLVEHEIGNQVQVGSIFVTNTVFVTFVYLGLRLACQICLGLSMNSLIMILIF